MRIIKCARISAGTTKEQIAILIIVPPVHFLLYNFLLSTLLSFVIPTGFYQYVDDAAPAASAFIMHTNN